MSLGAIGTIDLFHQPELDVVIEAVLATIGDELGRIGVACMMTAVDVLSGVDHVFDFWDFKARMPGLHFL